MAARRDADPEQSGWIRSNWLAEKISSGELPAANSELTRQADALFVGEDRLEDHARLLIRWLSLEESGAQADSGRRSDELSAYLQRLLSVREMWARERA